MRGQRVGSARRNGLDALDEALAARAEFIRQTVARLSKAAEHAVAVVEDGFAGAGARRVEAVDEALAARSEFARQIVARLDETAEHAIAVVEDRFAGPRAGG